MVDALESPPFQDAVEAFRVDHGAQFVRNRGGYYPIHLTELHADFQALYENHLDAHLGSVGYAMADGGAIAAACDRAILSGRCADHTRQAPTDLPPSPTISHCLPRSLTVSHQSDRRRSHDLPSRGPLRVLLHIATG